MKSEDRRSKKVNWKKVLITSGVLALGTFIAIRSKHNEGEDELGAWLESASDDELSNAYEEKRQEHIKNGFPNNEPRSPEMERINSEISRRAEEKWESDPRRNTDPNYRWTDEARWDRD